MKSALPLCLLVSALALACSQHAGDTAEDDDSHVENSDGLGVIASPLSGGKILKIGWGVFKALSATKSIIELAGLSDEVFGVDKTTEQLTEISKTLSLVKASIETSAGALQERQDDLMAALATVMTYPERQKFAEELKVSTSRVGPSDTSPIVLGYFFSPKVSAAEKRRDAIKFVGANSAEKNQRKIEALDQKYARDGYLTNAARAYALSAARSPNPTNVRDAFERLEEDYQTLSLYEYSLILLFAASEGLTGVTDSTNPTDIAKAAQDARSARGDLQHFLPIWAGRVKEHRDAYLRAAGMMAGILGSVYELNTWRDGAPVPLSEFGTMLDRAALASEEIVLALDPQSARRHHLILVRAVDVPVLKPVQASARYVYDRYCDAWAGSRCLRSQSYGSRLAKTEVVTLEIDSRAAGNYAYFEKRDNQVHLTKSGKWVLYDVQVELPNDSWAPELLLQLSYTMGQSPRALPDAFSFSPVALVTAAIDARYLGESARFDKLPFRVEPNQYRNTWAQFHEERTPGTFALNAKLQTGEDESAGADNFGRLDVIVDERLTGAMWNSWRSEMHHIGFETTGGAWMNDYERNNDASLRVSLTYRAKIGDESFIDSVREPKDAGGDKQKGRMFWKDKLPTSESFFEDHSQCASSDESRGWTPRSAKVDLPAGKHLILFQTGYNAKPKSFFSTNRYFNFLSLAVGVGGVNFFVLGHI